MSRYRVATASPYARGRRPSTDRAASASRPGRDAVADPQSGYGAGNHGPADLARTSASGTASAVAAGRAPHDNTAVGAPHDTHRSRGRAARHAPQPRARAARHARRSRGRRTTRTAAAAAVPRPRPTHTRTPFTQNTPRHYKHGARLQNGVFFPRRSGLGLARESAKAASITTNGRRTPAVGDLSQRYTPAGTRAPPAKLGRPPRRAPPRPSASVRPRRVTRILLPMDPSETTRVEAKRFVRVRRQPPRRARHGGRRAAAGDALRPAGDRRVALPRASPPRSARGRVRSSAATAHGR